MYQINKGGSKRMNIEQLRERLKNIIEQEKAQKKIVDAEKRKLKKIQDSKKSVQFEIENALQGRLF